MVIIHISGASGSGKSYLGKKLLDLFDDRIIIKCIDDLRVDFMKQHYGDSERYIIDKDAYQEFINRYVEQEKKKDKPLIFVGINNNPYPSWQKDIYYSFHSNYNFYIGADKGKGLYGKNASIDKNTKLFAFFSEIIATGSDLVSMPERSNVYINYLIDESGSLTELSQRDYDLLSENQK